MSSPNQKDQENYQDKVPLWAYFYVQPRPREETFYIMPNRPDGVGQELVITSPKQDNSWFCIIT